MQPEPRRLAIDLPSVADFHDRKAEIEQAEHEKKREADEAARKRAADEKLKADVAAAERAQREKAEADRQREADRQQAADMATRSEKRLAAWRELAFDGTDTKRLDPTGGSDGRGSSTDVDLCAFDADHLIGPKLSFACAPGPHASPLRVEAEPAAKAADPSNGTTWVVTTDVYEELSGRLRPRVVCRLIGTNGRLLVRWPRKPDQPLTTEDHAFTTLQNSLLLVFARDPESEAAPPAIRRTIAFAAPVVAPPLTLDPLTGRRGGDFDPALARRIKGIDPGSLRWDFELTHPDWPEAKHLRFPDTTLALTFPAAPPGGVPLAYEDVDEKDSIVTREGHLRIEATVTFSPTDATLSIDPAITGLDDAPLFKRVITLARLAAARDAPNADSFQPMVLDSLQRRPGAAPVRRKFFDVFLAASRDAADLGIRDAAALEQTMADLPRRRSLIKVPGKPNLNPDGVVLHPDTPENRREYERQMDDWIQWSSALTMIESAFELEQKNRTHAEAARAANAIDALAWSLAEIIMNVGIEAVTHDPAGASRSIVLAAP